MVHSQVIADGPELPTPDYKKTAYKIIAAQILLTLAVAGLLLAVGTAKLAYSALAGGLISVVSGFYLAAKLFSFDQGVAPERILRAFFVGEAVKVAITVVMFTVIIVALDTEILIVVLTYIATLLVYWFALLGTVPNERISRTE